MRVGAEVSGPLSLAPTHHESPGPHVVHGDRQERIGLVVAKANVETRPVLLDERVLEHQRLDLVANRRPLDGLCGLDHLASPRMQVARCLEIIREALPKIGRLADVNHSSVYVLELIRARNFGDRAGWGTSHHGPARIR